MFSISIVVVVSGKVVFGSRPLGLVEVVTALL